MSSALSATGGRVESTRSRTSGAVYTPAPLAAWVAARLLHSLPEGAHTIADFACGEGALLSAVEAAASRPLRLLGADVDPIAIRRAAAALPTGRFTRLDAISASLKGFDSLLRELDAKRIDGIVLNPPWGIELEASRTKLREAFQLARGQCDSADLFLELAVELLPDGGAAVLILPDSLFFPDRAPLRRFLLETCTLDLVARLGEGFFEGVFRGTAVVALRRGPAPPRHAIECLRLSSDQRKRVLAGEETLESAAAAGAHSVPQSRFARSGGAAFSVDLRQADLKHVRAVCRLPADWTRTLKGGRGVELSKHGEVIVCAHCERSRPRPRRSAPLRCECGAVIDPSRSSHRRIVRPIEAARRADWKPLIAGEDVRRYRCAPSREIETGIDGINYKGGVQAGDRLLVRKTGIGLKAAIYSGRALTTQTVFHFRATPDTPDFLLRYALGVLCSRVMLAVHLKRTGENEWRSHPYVTQSLLAGLPIPHPEPGTQQWRQAIAIADLVPRRGGRGPTAATDLEIERLVAGLYDFEGADMYWVARVLNEAQSLEGISTLRLTPDASVDPLVVN